MPRITIDGVLRMRVSVAVPTELHPPRNSATAVMILRACTARFYIYIRHVYSTLRASVAGTRFRQVFRQARPFQRHHEMRPVSLINVSVIKDAQIIEFASRQVRGCRQRKQSSAANSSSSRGLAIRCRTMTGGFDCCFRLRSSALQQL